MKKQYIQPELEAIDIKVNTILCASLEISVTEFDNNNALAPELTFDFESAEPEFEFEEDEDIAY